MTTPKSQSKRARQVGDAGRRQRTDQQHVDAGGDEARLERRLEHVARHARVLADQHRAALGRQHARRGARQAQREIHGHRVLADPAANAVGAEILPCHRPTLPAAPAPRPRAPHRTVAATSCARTMRAPLQHRNGGQRHAAGQPLAPTARPVSLPISDLRDRPTSSGSPSAPKLAQAAAAARDCAPASCRSRSPGRCTMRSRRCRPRRRPATRAARNAATSATTSS